MYNRGEKIFYGQTGVCTVEDISEKEFERGNPRIYYTLRPLYRSNNIIYAPVENAKVYMRRLISSDEAKRLIAGISAIQEKAQTELAGEEDFRACLESHSCAELLELAAGIYRIKREAKKSGKKIGFTYEKYMSRAEELAFGELAAALGVSPEDIPALLSNEEKICKKHDKNY